MHDIIVSYVVIAKEKIYTEKISSKKKSIYLPTIGIVYLCPARKYSIIIVNATVVRLRVVYMGTFTPRTDSIVTSFQGENGRTGRH